MKEIKNIIVILLLVSVLVNRKYVIAADIQDKQQSYLILTDRQNIKKEIEPVMYDKIILGNDNDLYTVEVAKKDVQQLEKNKGVIVEPDITLYALEKINNQKFTNALESLYQSDWVRKATHSERVILGKNKVRVAIIDSGLDIESELENVEKVNFIEDYYSNTDATGHGTMITNIMSEHKTMFGDQGIIPEKTNIELVNLRVLDQQNQTPLSRVLEALQWCIDNKVNVINMSFGTNVNSEALHYMIQKAAQHNILMVAAVGNQGENNGKVQYPAAYKEVLGVGSVNEKMTRSSFSSVGDGVSLMAPGENLPLNSYMGLIGVGSGTSFSAPYVTALAAALWSFDITKGADYIRNALEQGAVAIGEKSQCGYGIVNYENSYRLFITNQVNLNHQENLVKEEIQSFEVPEYIKGSWSYNLHQHLIIPTKMKGNKNKREIKDHDCKMIRNMSYYVDTNSKMKDYDVLHARKTTNYVSATKVLFEASRKWGGSFKTQEQLKSSMTQYIGAGTTEETKESIRQLKHIAEIATTKIIEKSESKKNICAYKDAKKMTASQINQGRMQLLGIAIHIAGDTYAHKSMCVTDKFKTIANKKTSNGTKVSSYMVKSVDEICNMIKSGNTTTAGLGQSFFSDAKICNLYYTDTDAYMTARYNKATANATSYLLENFVQNEPFTLYTFCPYQKDAKYSYKTKIWSTCMEKVDVNYKKHMDKYSANKLENLSHK